MKNYTFNIIFSFILSMYMWGPIYIEVWLYRASYLTIGWFKIYIGLVTWLLGGIWIYIGAGYLAIRWYGSGDILDR